MRIRSLVAVAGVSVALLVSGCASKPHQSVLDEGEVSDPWEGFNRGVYAFNNVVDGVLIKPLAKTYNFVVPRPARKGVTNFLHNLASPANFANAVFQGNSEQSFTILWRFILNSTLGVGGLFDFAGYHGLVASDEDFGQTLAVYGVGPGPYIVLPIIGPSNLRDAVGKVADAFLDPINYLDEEEWIIAHKAAVIIDRRSRTIELTDEVERTSIDPYATFRSGYSQYRENEIKTRK